MMSLCPITGRSLVEEMRMAAPARYAVGFAFAWKRIGGEVGHHCVQTFQKKRSPAHPD